MGHWTFVIDNGLNNGEREYGRKHYDVMVEL